MRISTIKSFTRGVLVASACLVAHLGAARAEPDLIINVADSYVEAGSCEKAAPIATGRIAIKNVGTTRAKLRLGEGLVRSMLAVYVPENVDMIAKERKGEALDPFDQEGIAFRLAENIQKKGRFFGDPSTRLRRVGRSGSETDRITAIQRALASLGYDPKGIDGLNGPKTRAATRLYQRDKGYTETGNLTPTQVDELLEKAGYTVTSSTGANGKVTVRIFAIVDPYNLIPETNEANNIETFTIEVDCSN